MLMRFEPFRDFDRITEEPLSERRVHQVPVDAYRRGDEFKMDFDLPGADPGHAVRVGAGAAAVQLDRSRFGEVAGQILPSPPLD